MASRAPAPAAGERFRLLLAEAAAVEDLRAWLADAAEGGQAVYASGLVLPRDAAGVVLVGQWLAAGLVTTHQRRDPHDARRWQFLVAKRPSKPAAPAVRDVRTRGELRALLDHMRRVVQARRACPSNAELARSLDLGPGARGRNRAQYLLDLLVRDGVIALDSPGRCAPRTVTVLPGRAKVKSKLGESN